MGSELHSEINIPTGVEAVWQYPSNIKITEEGIKLDEELTGDRFLGMVLKEKEK
jgi:hypothetical protein